MAANQSFIYDICPDMNTLCFISLGINGIFSQCCALVRPKKGSFDLFESRSKDDHDSRPSERPQIPHSYTNPNTSTNNETGSDKNEVQVYLGKGSGIDFVKELIELLEKEQKTNEFEFRIVKTVENIKPELPLLVFCLTTSRVGTDASTAVRDVKDHKLSILLIFHHKELHAVPEHSSSQQLVGKDFQNFNGIFDLACYTGKGVHNCDLNN